MKIAFAEDLIYAYAAADSRAVGGAERQQWLLARALAKSGWAVVVGVRNGLKPGEHRTIEGVEFIDIAQGHVLSDWRRFLSSEHPDWWYRRTADHKLGLVIELARLSNVKTIFSTSFDSDVQPRRALTRRHRFWPLYAWGLTRVDRIFLQHGGQIRELDPRWRSKAYVVRSIADGQASAVKSHSERAKSVAWVGMLRQPKRPDLLVEIAQKAPDMHFVVCGGPSDHRSPNGYGAKNIADLTALTNVDYCGQVASAKAREIIANASVLLCTSDGEGFPNIFLEAWASGTPVVSLKIDPEGIIEGMQLGAVSGTIEKAIGDMNALLDSPQDRERIALRARRYIAEAHSEAAVTAAFERAIHGAGS